MSDEQLPRPRTGHTVDDFEYGDAVVYVPQYGPREDGIVTSKNDTMVFVRYKVSQVNGTATYPGDLELRHRKDSRAEPLR